MSERVPLPDDLTEDEALDVVHEMKSRFGWATKVWTRGDAADMLQNMDYENHETTGPVDSGSHSPPEMSDEVWERVQNSYYWHKSLEECRDHEWDCLSQAVEEALKDA